MVDVVSELPVPKLNPAGPHSNPHSVSLAPGNQEIKALEAVKESVVTVDNKGLGQVGASLTNKLSTKISL